MDDEERTRQTAQVLKLLDDSYLAYAAGNREESDRLGREACALDVDVVSVVQGGMLIGEIPRPEVDYHAWAEYVQAAQDNAARPTS